MRSEVRSEARRVGVIGRTTRARAVGVLVVIAGAVLALNGLSELPAHAAPTGNGSSSWGPGHDEHDGAYGEVDVNVCSDLVPVGFAHCDARVRTDVASRGSGVTANAVPSSSAYGPADLQAAYHAPSGTNGSGRTVAIVDANDDPNAESDLATYRSTYGLPPCTTANGCFRKVDQNGGTTYPAGDHGWSQEISLDLDMVSALCPQCHILLVEAKSASFSDLGTAVNRAVTLGADAVSNSYGAAESSIGSQETTIDSLYFNHPGVAITASSGDSGYGVEYPAAAPGVVAVGGTSLARNGTTFSETAWSRAGSGCSAYEAKPSWQTDAGCTRRSGADVAAVADPSTGVSVYDSYGDPGFEVFGGTSVSSPIVASFYAMANNPRSSTQASSYPYAHRGSLNDVVSGSNGSCGGSYLCTAGPGYDGPTGLGTPNGVTAFVAVAAPPNDFSISASPTTPSIAQGATGSSTISTAVTSGTAQTVALTVTGAPTGVTAGLSPTSVTAGSSATLNLAVGAATTPGTYPLTVTGTGSGTGATTHTTTVTLTVTAVSTTLQNGGFETGSLSPWTVTGSAGISTSAHSGTRSAIVGSTTPTNGDSSIAQSFVAPAGGPTLTVWYNIHCPDTVSRGWATAKLRDNTTGGTSTLLGKTCTNSGSWRSGTVGIIAGHSYTVTLTSHDDNQPGNATYVLYDDVAVTTRNAAGPSRPASRPSA
ncbi:MAG TPA: hypothetical protein VEP49_07275 [Acidimicrobiia bacterium]|nr:hypothetical protein [Acidimicrobiia bacterium]